MAWGTNTLIGRSGDDASAPLRADRFDIQGNSAYVVGGNTGLAAELAAELGVTPTIIDVQGSDVTGQYKLLWDGTNEKLMIIDLGAPFAEVAPGDHSGLSFAATVFSK